VVYLMSVGRCDTTVVATFGCSSGVARAEVDVVGVDAL
jgi:hypothetical protein